MPTRNVVLTEHQAALVENLVAGGRYQNASEDFLRLKALQAAVQVGLADSAAGNYTDFNSSQSLTAHLKSLATKAIAAA